MAGSPRFLPTAESDRRSMLIKDDADQRPGKSRPLAARPDGDTVGALGAPGLMGSGPGAKPASRAAMSEAARPPRAGGTLPLPLLRSHRRDAASRPRLVPRKTGRDPRPRAPGHRIGRRQGGHTLQRPLRFLPTRLLPAPRQRVSAPAGVVTLARLTGAPVLMVFVDRAPPTGPSGSKRMTFPSSGYSRRLGGAASDLTAITPKTVIKADSVLVTFPVDLVVELASNAYMPQASGYALRQSINGGLVRLA